VTADGKVWCWGYNAYGQLGDGTTVDRLLPVQVVGVSDATQVAVGVDSTCVLRGDKKVLCWGSTSYGRIGIPSAGNQLTPIVTGLTEEVVQIAGGNGFFCALTAGGTVRCWGRNNFGQLGNGLTSDSHTSVLVSGLTNVVQIATGSLAYTVCARLSDGTLRCWGLGTSGQLGRGSSTNSSVPVTVSGISTAVSISVENATSCAVLQGGALRCWGSNSQGQIGGVVGVGRTTPGDISGVANVSQVAVGDKTIFIRTSDNRIFALGDNDEGQLGNPTLSLNSVVPVSISRWALVRDVPSEPTGILAIGSTNSSLTLAWSAPNSNGGWALADYLVEMRARGGSWEVLNDGISADARVTAQGLTLGSEYQFRITAVNGTGSGSPSVESEYFQVSNPPTDIPSLRVVARGTGSVTLAWDAPSANQGVPVSDYVIEYRSGQESWITFEDGTSTETTTTVTGLTTGIPYQFRVRADNNAPLDAAPAYLGEVSQISLSNHSCVLTNQREVQCWGPNSNGEIGRGAETAGGLFPQRVTLANQITQISAGASHTCALKINGTVLCWGYMGPGNSEPLPRQVEGLSDVVQLSSGMDYSCAVTSVGQVKCWGSNAHGTLGIHASASIIRVPLSIQGISTARKVVSSAYHACALLSDGTVRCWGSNARWQLGNGSSTSSVTPVVVSGLSGVTDLSAGSWIYSFHTCALTSAGAVRCWGEGDNGRLGTGSTSDRSTPATVISSGVKAISVNDAFSCAVLTTGELRCWGWNGHGQLGQGNTTTYLSPVAVPGLTDVRTVSAGAYHVCAVASDNELYCWGANSYGQIGPGQASFLSPERIQGLTEFPLSPPGKPAALVLTREESGGSLRLSVEAPVEDGGTSVTGYQYSLDGDTWSDPFDETAKQVDGLTNGTIYTVYVRALNLSDIGTPEYSSVKVGAVPDAPINLTSALVPTGRALSLSFVEPPNNGEEITTYEYQLDGGSWVAREDGKSVESPLLIENLENGVAYSIRLRAVNNFGRGAASSSVIDVPKGPPGAPTILGVTNSDRQVSLNFGMPSDVGGSEIQNVEVSLDGGAWSPRDPSSVTSPLVIRNLQNGVSRSIRIRLINEFGPGPSSEPISAIPSTSPAAPSIQTIVAPTTGAQLSVRFLLPADDGGQAINDIDYRINNGPWSRRSDGGGSSSPLIITGLVNGTNYSISIRARNNNGAGPSSNVLSGTPRTTPSSPSISKVTHGDRLLRIFFESPSSDGGSSILNYEYSVNNLAWVRRDPTSTVSPIAIDGLPNGQSADVRVRAVNEVGAGSPSASVSGTPSRTPSAPSIEAITAPSSGGKLSIRFLGPQDAGGAAIETYQYRLDGGPWVARTDGRTVASPLDIAGLADRTPYSVELRAVNVNGGGDPSSAVVGMPVWIPPLPELKTPEASSVGPNNAKITTSVRAGDASATVYFEVSLTASFANVWNTGKSTVQSSADFQSVSAEVNDLEENTTYFFRAVSENISGLARGDVGTFQTTAAVGVSIEDGATYTNSASVAVSVVSPVGAIGVVLSNDGGFRSSRRFSLAPTIRWTLSTSGSERLPKTLYARFVMGNGSRSVSYTDDIILDDTVPTVSSIKLLSRTKVGPSPDEIEDAAVTSGGGDVKFYRLSIAAKDERSGITSVQVRGRTSVEVPYDRRLLIASRDPKVRIRVQDGAGNWSQWFSVDLRSGKNSGS
jgi:alpha-tubulin suppressor-like RCC1 family protein